MRFVRITANYQGGGHVDADYRIVIQCVIDDNSRIADGEWMGYSRCEQTTYPFVLRRHRELFYGGEEPFSERTNLEDRDIVIGEYFTVLNDPEEVYQIVHIHDFGELH